MAKNSASSAYSNITRTASRFARQPPNIKGLPMTPKKLDAWVENLAEQYGLSMQLTRAWLVNNGFTSRAVKVAPLTTQQVTNLVRFARV